MSNNVIINKLENAMNMNNEFVKVICDQELKLRISGVRSSTIGNQIACVARARDAYSKSIMKDVAFDWCPDFPYEDRYDQVKLDQHLQAVGHKLLASLRGSESLSENQLDLIVDLISHEFLHQGQLARYFYANALTMPSMTKKFWHLED